MLFVLPVRSDMGNEVISELLPALGRTFAVIFIGYLLSKFKFVTEQNASILGIIVGKITLPALILQNLALLNLNEINWRFMAGILITRCLIFAGVFIITLIFTRPVNIGMPAILSIFCTHSNTFALGLPICKSIFVHNYLYECLHVCVCDCSLYIYTQCLQFMGIVSAQVDLIT